MEPDFNCDDAMGALEEGAAASSADRPSFRCFFNENLHGGAQHVEKFFFSARRYMHRCRKSLQFTHHFLKLS